MLVNKTSIIHAYARVCKMSDYTDLSRPKVNQTNIVYLNIISSESWHADLWIFTKSGDSAQNLWFAMLHSDLFWKIVWIVNFSYPKRVRSFEWGILPNGLCSISPRRKLLFYRCVFFLFNNVSSKMDIWINSHFIQN